MLKKLLYAAVATFVMLSMFSVPFFAETVDGKELPPENAIGYLQSEEGSITPIIGYLQDVPCPVSDSELSGSVTYMFPVEARLIKSKETTQSDTDNTYSVRYYLTLSYKYDDTKDKHLLTAVSGYWTILDSKVRVTDAMLSYGCNDAFGAGSNQICYNLSVSNHFSVSTGFKNYVQKNTVGEPFDGAVGAYLVSTLRRGAASNWTFKITNML